MMLMGGLEGLLGGQGGCSVSCTVLDHNLILFFPHISYSFVDSMSSFSALKKTNTKFPLLLLGYGGTRRR